MITVITPPTYSGYVSLSAIKTELGISGSGDDAFLNTCIAQASRAIDGYCGRSFALQTVKETVKGYGTNRLLVTITPIVTLTAIRFGDDLIEVPAANYAIASKEAGSIRSKVGGFAHTASQYFGTVSTPVAGSEEPLYEIEYTGGYAENDLPADINRACTEMVKDIYFARKRDGAVKSEAVPEVYSVTYKDISEDINSKSQYNLLLSRYRRIVI